MDMRCEKVGVGVLGPGSKGSGAQEQGFCCGGGICFFNWLHREVPHSGHRRPWHASCFKMAPGEALCPSGLAVVLS